MNEFAPEREVRSFDYERGGENQLPAKAALDADGVVCIREAIGPDWLDVIEEGITAALGGASADIDIVQRDGDVGRFSFSSGAWRDVGEFRQFIFESHLADIVWPLLGSDQLALFYDFLLIKQARSDSAETPWHQDHSYYPLDGVQVVNSWVALDDIPVESALRFAAGSHRPQTLLRAVDFEDPDRQYRHARHELKEAPRTVDPGAVLVAPLQAGDMLVWWSYTLHSAPGNRLAKRRAAFSVNWIGDDVTYNGQAALDTYSVPGPVVGESMVSEKFPVVRPI